ncbi:MAG: hypothetical protein JW779_05720 [Candidatus Thorarchaeota archaeon]|nr:hypothetical protein [Candidatus Thorarchaeota archaeon]
MSKSSIDSDLKTVLNSIEKRLKSIQDTLTSFEQRIGTLERTVEQKIVATGENPLIYSRVLMGTVDAIRDYEKEHEQGVVAKDLARIRGVELPTIYDHLSKLEESNLIFWQRGTELGLKPHNAKFYSLQERDEHLEDIPVLMSLPERVIPVAQSIIKYGKEGVRKEILHDTIKSLTQKKDKAWSDVPLNKIDAELDDVLKYLLRRVLIRSEKTIDSDYYYLRSE